MRDLDSDSVLYREVAFISVNLESIDKRPKAPTVTKGEHSTGLGCLVTGGVAINEAIEVLNDLMSGHSSDLKSRSGFIKGLKVKHKLKECRVFF